ncbi:MAG TPA: hypothetical protein PK640_21300, partial [Verrucomicrobiota bacterium]|nr:hypothetical protein [Verrucomicrobiota bacterium]
HIADLASLSDRVALDIGATASDVLDQPTDVRLKRYADGHADPQLESMMFCYGRYLLASCSRPGALPANLQGLWNDSNTPPNLFCNHPPFQMDGNFGITAAIAEMLPHSHAGEIAVLPALPNAWAPNGSFRGLKARGNFTVDAAWKDGKVTNFAIRSPEPRSVRVRVNGELKTLTSTTL